MDSVPSRERVVILAILLPYLRKRLRSAFLATIKVLIAITESLY
jgi:hypothetical protein